MSYLYKAWRILKGPLGDMLKAFLKVLWLLVSTELYAIVKEAVAMVQADPSIITDEDKRKAALAYIKDKAGQAGIFVRDSVANLLIEARVAVMNILGGGE